MDDDEPSYMFSSLNDLLHFVKWLTENFDNPKDFEEALDSISADDSLGFEEALDLVLRVSPDCTRSKGKEREFFECPDCGAIFATPSGLNIHCSVIHSDNEELSDRIKQDDEFWDIVKNSYTDHQEELDDDLHDTD
jgi:hypothetical protein